MEHFLHQAVVMDTVQKIIFKWALLFGAALCLCGCASAPSRTGTSPTPTQAPGSPTAATEAKPPTPSAPPASCPTNASSGPRLLTLDLPPKESAADPDWTEPLF